MKVGAKINHSKFGQGTIILDEESPCHKDEILVKFDSPIGKLKPSSSERALSIDDKIDIVKISECSLN